MPLLIALPRRLLIVFAVFLTLGLMGGISFLQLPRARVTVQPTIERREAVQEIVLSTAVQDPDFVRFRLPARVVEAEATREQIIERTGAARHDDFARGTVMLHNELPEVQELLPKTHLRHESSGVFFLTDGPATIPARGETAMTVTAQAKGAAGNVPAGRFVIDKLSPDLQRAVYAESPRQMSGGVAVDEPLSENEISRARESMAAGAREEVRGKLSAAAGGASMREDLMKFEETDVAVSAEPGSTAATFSVRVTVRGRALLVDETDLLGLTVLKLRELGGPDQEFVTYDPHSFSASIIRSDFERGEAVVQGKLSGKFAHKLGLEVFSGQNLAGLSGAEVKERLQKLPGVGDVAISFWPFWVHTVPSRPEQVDISVANDQ
ncbi:MAG: hypothetical protein COT71_03070 [Candidatus Andersenbacteria bacterium CG10_big_fil_rev_8_21_14_0_10_54_11]|uniref:Baseplate protein J-like barrel domain-containing protein n=1 Tax=Candidatus Andersenbacteria bacterium CG10_big_fil_rev_8_21_14_0_10_54_11 TaxID=1974485 RepID=A0A2M6WYV8_9BACT|nr:MAG: hypothetical protein COT71_03070 [Candidatus Andersenbacteria bacterium CG10_big_fil_rev_8_21_14_0_10_54_11]